MNVQDCERLAHAGDPEAQHWLASWYFHGDHGKRVDRIIAFGWYQRAANLGHAESMLTIGMRHEDGVSLIKDRVEALKWYILARDHGHKDGELVVHLTIEGMSAEDISEAENRANHWIVGG